MKLLLTSAGLTSKPIVKALYKMAGVAERKIHIAYIPTAANVESGDKSWLLKDLLNFKKQGYGFIDIVDISAIPPDIWKPRLEAANVLVFGGGNTYHLMYSIEKSGLIKILHTLLKTRVYVGISAGSLIAAKNLDLSQSEKLYSKEIGKVKIKRGLGLVKFHIRPHLNSKIFPKIRKDFLEKTAKAIPDPIYAIDDRTAVRVVDKKTDVVGTGKYLVFNNITE